MNYEPKFINGYSINDCKSEIKRWYDRRYRYGYGIDYCRIWDLEYTIKELESSFKNRN